MRPSSGPAGPKAQPVHLPCRAWPPRSAWLIREVCAEGPTKPHWCPSREDRTRQVRSTLWTTALSLSYRLCTMGIHEIKGDGLCPTEDRASLVTRLPSPCRRICCFPRSRPSAGACRAPLTPETLRPCNWSRLSPRTRALYFGHRTS